MPAPAAPALPNWAQVHGDSLLDAQIRTSNADFEVTELLDPETCDDGEHDYLWIEKTGTNTQAQLVRVVLGSPATLVARNRY